MTDEKRKILIVDDDAVIQRAFDFRFKKSNYEIIHATDGSTAVNLVRTAPPDAILLDITFPTEPGAVTWDGFGILSWMKRMDTLKDVPIFIISGTDPAQYSAKVKELGAAGFFQKPLNYPAMIQVLDRFFARLQVAPKP